MKTILIICLLVGSISICNAQNDIKSERNNRSYVLAMQSREKADIVLHIFDTIASPKLLYSIDDKFYLLLMRCDESFSEYYVRLSPRGRIREICLLEKHDDKTELFNSAFNLVNYNSEFIMDNRDIISAKKYFVVKDKNGNRFGECSVLSLPFVHIEEELSVYLAARLAEVTHHK